MVDRAPSEPDKVERSEEPAPTQSPDAGDHDPYSRWLIAGIPVTIAVLSFALSLFTWYQSNRPPDVDLTLPDGTRHPGAGGSLALYPASLRQYLVKRPYRWHCRYAG